LVNAGDGHELAVDAAYARLRAVLASYGSVVVAFSGGVDSALVAWVASRELGDNAVALTADSETLPPEERQVADAFARKHGLRHHVVASRELLSEAYQKNDGTRCYHCKTELFDLAEAERARLGFAFVADGTLPDDLGDDRPGLRAASEHAVRHPLLEAQVPKAVVRALAARLGLEVADKPSFACLGSRFPVGTRVTATRLGMVSKLESVLRKLGFAQVRVRYHELSADPSGDGIGAVMARIEVPPSDIARVSAPEVRDVVRNAAREAGFRWVTVDLAGYRSVEEALSEALARVVARGS
jgi:uncharacterized protein